MSLDSWKAEFYPVGADDPDAVADALAATRHSLLKWRGLRAAGLARHQVVCGSGNFIREEGLDGRAIDYLDIDGSSCALCVRYFDRQCFGTDVRCVACPIFKATDDDCSRQYRAWVATGSPAAMVALLECVEAFLLERERADAGPERQEERP